jgi:hypothetical protein
LARESYTLLATINIVDVFPVKYALKQTKQFGFKKNGVADVWNWERHLSSDDMLIVIHDE